MFKCACISLKYGWKMNLHAEESAVNFSWPTIVFKTGGMVIVWDKDLPHFLTKLTFNLTLNKITLTFSTEIYCSCSFRKEGDAFLAREPLVPLWMQVPLPHPSVLDLWGLTTCHRFLPHPSSAQHGQDIILLSRV